MPEGLKFRTVRPLGSERLLIKRRAWWDGDQQGDSEGTAGDRDPQVKITALEKRLAERDAKLAEKDAALQRLQEQMTAAEKDRQKKMAEEGNYKALLEEARAEIASLTRHRERADRLDALIRESNDATIARLPEDRRNIVTDLNIPPEELQTWLNKYMPMLIKPPAPNLDGGAGGAGTTGQEVQLTAEEKEYARMAGMTEKEYAEYKGKTGQPVAGGSAFQG